MTVDLYELYDIHDKLEGYRVVIGIHLFGRLFWTKVFEYHTTGNSEHYIKSRFLRDVS